MESWQVNIYKFLHRPLSIFFCPPTGLKCVAVINFNFKNPTWRTAAILKMEKSWYLMMQNRSLKRISCPPL